MLKVELTIGVDYTFKKMWSPASEEVNLALSGEGAFQ